MLDYSSSIRISNNTIDDNNQYGVHFNQYSVYYDKNDTDNEITGNQISNNEIGLRIFGTRNDQIFENKFTDNDVGFSICDVVGNNAFRNHFENNTIGASVEYGYLNDMKLAMSMSFTENNFLTNTNHATFIYPIVWYLIGTGNNWDRNYWDNHLGLGRKIIRGFVVIPIFFPWYPNWSAIPFLGRDYDRHPAQVPYDIPMGTGI